ncbi:MAG: Crp/Fnr family transcriptional regulator [Alphaproteobacteria bacterium]
MKDETVHSLAGINLFSDLKKQELVAVEKNCHWRRYASHQQIIDKDGHNSDIYFVVSGSVRIVNYSFSGRGIILDELPTGSHFGELSAIDGKPRSARVVSLGESVVASMSRAKFLKTLVTHPELAIKVMVVLAGMVRVSTQRIMDLSTLGANNRVHADLLRLAGEFGDDATEIIIDPMPIHNDIASRVSTTRETVARVMNDLARRGLVKKMGNKLIINDVQRLQEMVEEVRGE